MHIMSKLIACRGCDLLVDIGGLEDNCRANCPRCGHFLTRFQSDAMSRVLAFTIAAVVLLGLASSFPFLSFSSSGIESVMTLPGAPGSLFIYGMPALGVMVAAFIIVIPSLILTLIVMVCVPLQFGWRAFQCGNRLKFGRWQNCSPKH